jgi:protein-tyrosine sulfotransferase
MRRWFMFLITIAMVVCSEANLSLHTCTQLMERFQLRDRKNKIHQDPSKMLWFLHIPRSAGRTFHSCFLKLAHPPSKRCAKSYDTLRLNVSLGSCGLLASHDDYSATDFLPAEAAIVTQLREPLDRVLSAYEFAVEVAARILQRPSNYTADPSKTNTRDVWPWSRLVPLIEQDLLLRVGG